MTENGTGTERGIGTATEIETGIEIGIEIGIGKTATATATEMTVDETIGMTGATSVDVPVLENVGTVTDSPPLRLVALLRRKKAVQPLRHHPSRTRNSKQNAQSSKRGRRSVKQRKHSMRRRPKRWLLPENLLQVCSPTSQYVS